LQSFLKVNTFKNYRIIVASHPGMDGLDQIIEEFDHDLVIQNIKVEAGLTSSYLLNRAADQASSEFLLFIKPAVRFNDDILPALITYYASNPSTGMIGTSVQFTNLPGLNRGGMLNLELKPGMGLPEILNPVIDAKLVRSETDYPGARELRINGEILLNPGKKYPHPVLATGPDRRVQHSSQTPLLSGELLFIQKEDFIKAGGFNLNLFEGYECPDLCLRVEGALKKQVKFLHDLSIEAFRPSLSQNKKVEAYNIGAFIRFNGRFLRTMLYEEDDGPALYWNKSSYTVLEELGLSSGKTSDKPRIALKLPIPSNVDPKMLGDYHFGEALQKALRKLGYPVRVDFLDDWYDHSFLEDDIVFVIRGLYKYQPRAEHINIMWNISHPDKVSDDEYERYDHVFVASYPHAQNLDKRLNVRIEPLLQCTDPESFYPEPNDETSSGDLLFVGNWRAKDRKAVYHAVSKNLPLSVFGRKWEGHLEEKFIKGQAIPNERLRHYYSSYRIILNDHWTDMAEKGFINNRIFDAAACGGITLSDPVSGFSDILSKGVFFYSDADDFAEQVNHINDNLEELKRTALENSRYIRSEHSFDARAKNIIKAIERLNNPTNNK
jgi:glycosyltransferase involved in cell wall biosynthesis